MEFDDVNVDNDVNVDEQEAELGCTSFEQLKTETFDQEIELKCYECLEVFIFSTHLREHIKNEHDIDEAFQCPCCFKTFKQVSALNFHVKCLHTENNKQKFICSVCSESFSKSVHFRSHMKDEHNQENVFPCPSCPKSFKEARHVTFHIRKVHKNERPFSCSQCSKSFQLSGMKASFWGLFRTNFYGHFRKLFMFTKFGFSKFREKFP